MLLRSIPCILFSLLLLLSASTNAQDPKKKDKVVTPKVVFCVPFGLDRGVAGKVTVRGQKLDGATQVVISDDSVKAKIVSKGSAAVPDKNPDQVGDTQVVIEMVMPAQLDKPLSLKVVTPDGESNAFQLVLEERPPLKEKEPNEGFRQAQEVTLPIVIDGAIDRARDVDVYRFAGKKGQKVAWRVRANRYGSPLDSILTLYDEKGQQLARSADRLDPRDADLSAVLPSDGVYFIVLQDAHDTGSPLHLYRLEGQ